MGGDSGGGGEGAILQSQKAEEARKNALRSKLNSFYGIDAPYTAPDTNKFTTYDENGMPYLDSEAYEKADAAARLGDPVAASAREQLEKEEADLEKSNRDYYTEDLEHSFKKAGRQNRFALADRGLLGGSAQIDSEGELDRDNVRGAGRIEDEVRNAVAALSSGREQERLNATQLINSGAGESVISGAQAGLARAFQNAAAQRKADITSDLFSTAADNVAIGQNVALNQAQLNAYRNAMRSFYNAPESRGSITPT